MEKPSLGGRKAGLSGWLKVLPTREANTARVSSRYVMLVATTISLGTETYCTWSENPDLSR
jgi:hypothetical protein